MELGIFLQVKYSLFSKCFFQSSFLSCSIFTFRTRISYSFMFTFNMCPKIPCCSCGIYTLRTRISHSFMFIFNMSLQIPCCSYGMVTLRARKSDSFVFIFNMSLQNPCCSSGIFTENKDISLLHVYFQHVSSGNLL